MTTTTEKLARCWYCGTELQDHVNCNDVRKLRVQEHQLPISRGGLGTQTVPACFSCNSRKGPRTVEEYRRWLRVNPSSVSAALLLRTALKIHDFDPATAGTLQRIADGLLDDAPPIFFYGERQCD